MIKTKLVAVCSAVVAVLALSAAPAFAEFQSNSGSTAGAAKLEKLEIDGGGLTLVCASADGEWKIQTAGKIKEHEVGTKQVKALKGPQQYIPINKFNTCTAKSAEFKELMPAVSACTYHLAQQTAGTFLAKGAFVNGCKVSIKILFFTCEIILPPADEESGVNFNLETNELENNGNKLLVKVAETGITSEPTGTCPGIKATKEAKLKGYLSEQGVKAV